MTASIFALTVTVALVIAMVDDLATRKVHNWLVIVIAVITLFLAILLQGTSGLLTAASGFVTAVVVMLPLVLTRSIGAGDMKLMMAVSFLMDWQAVILTVGFSLAWGGLLGLLQAILKGQLLLLLKNILIIINRKSHLHMLRLHRIPFTVALFFGWLTWLTWIRLGGHL